MVVWADQFRVRKHYCDGNDDDNGNFRKLIYHCFPHLKGIDEEWSQQWDNDCWRVCCLSCRNLVRTGLTSFPFLWKYTSQIAINPTLPFFSPCRYLISDNASTDLYCASKKDDESSTMEGSWPGLVLWTPEAILPVMIINYCLLFSRFGSGEAPPRVGLWCSFRVPAWPVVPSSCERLDSVGSKDVRGYIHKVTTANVETTADQEK